MSKEWKPGDVAMVKVEGREGEVLGLRDTVGWATNRTDRQRSHAHWTNAEYVTPLRPLVVIDPGSVDDTDLVDVDRLDDLLWALEYDHDKSYTERYAIVAAALREFANPKPPRIDEPGTWGVVEAACVHSDLRREWVKFPSGNWHSIRDFDDRREDIENPDDWDSLVDPKLIREGVQ